MDNEHLLRSDNPNKATCTFSELIPLLAELFDPDPKNVIALAGRAKNLARCGLLPQGGSGRGIKRHYTREDVLDYLVAMALTHSGFNPSAAISLCHDKPDREAEILTFSFGQYYPLRLTLDMVGLRRAAARHFPAMFAEEV